MNSNLCTIEVQDQLWDEKKNTVTINVVCCCSPEKIRDMICYKGGYSIKGIDIVVPKPPDQKSKDQSDKPKAQAPAPKPVQPVPGSIPVGYVQAIHAHPIGTSCASFPQCYGGVPGGPYCYGQSGPPVPMPQYYQYDGGYIGRPVYDSYGNGSGGRGYCVNHSDYFSEENPRVCSIM